jgi:hypothetical protein
MNLIGNLLSDTYLFFYFLASTLSSHPAESIASLALFLTIWQGWLFRRHNLLSVRPYLALTTVTENLGKEKRRVTVTVRNSGLGPAKIIDFSIGKHGEVIIVGQIEPDAWGYLLSELCKLEKVELASTRLAQKRFIAPDEEINLLSATYVKPIDREFDIHRETWLAIKYMSLYGEKFYGGYGAINPKPILFLSKISRIKRKILG